MEVNIFFNIIPHNQKLLIDSKMFWDILDFKGEIT